MSAIFLAKGDGYNEDTIRQLKNNYNLMKIFILHIIIILNTFSNSAQGLFTWQECTEYALAHNYNIKIKELSIQDQELNLKKAQFNFMPSVDGNINFSGNSGNSIDPSTNTITNKSNYSNRYGIGSSITLFNGFTRINRIKFEKYNLQYRSERLISEENLIAFSVISKFTEVIFYKGLKDIAIEQAHISQQALNRNKKLYKLGRISKSEVIEVEAQLMQDSLYVIETEILYSMGLIELKKEMSYPLFERLNLEDLKINAMILGKTGKSKEEILLSAKKTLPQVQVIQLMLKAAQAKLREIKGHTYPKLSLGASWGTSYNSTTRDDNNIITSYNNQIPGNAQTNVRLSLNIPVFNRLSNQTSIKQANINYKIAEMEYKQKLTEIEYTVYNNILELESAIKQHQASIKNKKKQEIAFITASKRLEKGLINLIDFNIIKNQYARSQSNLLNSEMQLFLKTKTIQFYLTGKIL